jgi:hypothetical protein
MCVSKANWQQPQRSLDLLDVLLPPKLEFIRPAIEAVEAEQYKNLPKEVTDILQQSASIGPIAIYGSVSTSDIANFIKESVAYNDEASRVAISDSDIRFVGVSELEESTRVKHLGEYDIEITMKGGDGPVKRKVQVVTQKAEQPVTQKTAQAVEEEPKKEV